MSHIVIPIPPSTEEQNIEIEVSINGIKHQLRYKVAYFYWSDCANPTFDRAECIKSLLLQNSDEWMLYYIGAPTDDYVPITFIKKEDWGKQRRVTMEVV